VVSRLQLTAPSCFQSNTSSYPETVSQGRQVSREGEGSVRVVDCPTSPPACVLSWTAVMLSFSHRPPQWVEGDMGVIPQVPWRRFPSEQFYAVYVRLDIYPHYFVYYWPIRLSTSQTNQPFNVCICCLHYCGDLRWNVTSPIRTSPSLF